MKPIRLMPARAWRTYVGGRMIDALHGDAQPQDSHFPEEWLFSTVAARNAGREAFAEEGMSRLPDGTLFRDWLGDVQTGVLVKFLDAGERLTVQVHPDVLTARRLFHSPYGKTECWHILATREGLDAPACIYLGFRPEVTRAQWERLFAEQDIQGMLGCLHRFEVRPGDTFLIRGGVPHAIGAGCFLLEIQEPTDFTIRTERVTPSGLPVADSMCHQGLGFERMFDCFSYAGLTHAEAEAAWRIPPRPLSTVETEWVGYADTPCFRLTEWTISAPLDVLGMDAGYGMAVVAGHGTLVCGDTRLPVAPGDSLYCPARAEAFTWIPDGGETLRVMRCFGPAC